MLWNLVCVPQPFCLWFFYVSSVLDAASKRSFAIGTDNTIHCLIKPASFHLPQVVHVFGLVLKIYSHTLIGSCPQLAKSKCHSFCNICSLSKTHSGAREILNNSFLDDSAIYICVQILGPMAAGMPCSWVLFLKNILFCFSYYLSIECFKNLR